MTCIKCKKEKPGILLPHLPGEVCNECFCDIVEKRVRRDVRINRHFLNAKRILVLDDGSENAALCRYFVQELNEYSDTEFVFRKVSHVSAISGKKVIQLMTKLKAQKVVLPWNGSQESEQLLSMMVRKKGPENDDSRIVKLLKHLSAREVEIFCKIKGLGFKMKPMPVEPEIGKFLDELEKESPDIRFAIVRSFEKIGNSK